MKVPVTNVPTSGKIETVKLSERVQFVVNRSGRSMRDLSLSLGKSEKYIQKLIERDSERPDALALTALAHATGVWPSWLITGLGPRDVDPNAAPPIEERADAHENSGEFQPLSAHPEWSEALALAKMRAIEKGRAIPEALWQSLATLSVEGPVSAAALYDLAVVFHEHGLGRRAALATAPVAAPATGSRRLIAPPVLPEAPADPENESGLRRKFVPEEHEDPPTTQRVRTKRSTG